MKRSARILGIGLGLLFVTVVAGGGLTFVAIEDPLPDLVDDRMLLMAAFGIGALFLIAVLCLCTAAVRAAAAIDKIADETLVFARWTRLAGSEFPASALKNARQTPKQGSETSGATQRHARPATSSVPTVKTSTAAVPRVGTARSETAHLDSRSELDEHQRKLVAQYRAERGH
ncbi:hypothetical protein [Sanguibacter antarcticus]|uniref:Uncharacterized protein n=1 Tax=Sanguibacter antarcticus TaxID=372484 RepID=A0A2A9E9B1_9MICO|nr:hypothetical protein [Sanguibacter antarcticus]PFG34780.1 hypothetical protein ATL42_2703 [Sanguibacter antarcticus]